MDDLLNNNLKKSPHFGKCPALKTSTYPLEVLDLSCLFYCFNTRAAFSGYAETPEGKEGEKGKEKREKSGKSGSEKYLLLTEFEVRTVSYGPSFFPLQFTAQARSAQAINRRGNNVDP